jgi:hypothetical protein
LGPMHLGLKTGPLSPLFPVPLTKFQMAPTPSTQMSSGSKKKEPRRICLSEAKASHSHKICTEISSSVSHFLQVGLLLSPITCRCLLRVLCQLSRPITALVCVLLKDNNRAPVAKLGPEINSQACRCTYGTSPQCQMLVLHPVFHLRFFLAFTSVVRQMPGYN